MQTIPETTGAPVESTLARTWEHEARFDDLLYDWMQRAPWLALSAVAHALLLLILMAIPWDQLKKSEAIVFITDLDKSEDVPFIEPPPEPDPVIDDVKTDEPTPMDADEPAVDPVDDPSEASDADWDLDNSFPADVSGELSEIGIGGGWSGGDGSHFGPRGGPKGGRGVRILVENSLRWLRDHQALDGHWSAGGFMHDNALGRTCECDGAGQEVHDVGITSLALLAFLGDGNTTRSGPYREVVARGVAWLRDQQDEDSGLIGGRVGHGFIYDHAIATVALCEAYYYSRSPLLKVLAQRAVDYILLARNPYGAWRYDVPPSGDADTSVTGWMVLALASAEDGGLKIDRNAYAGALSWIDEMSDPSTGRVGYTSMGSPSSRIERINDHFPTDKGEAMTAVGLLSRFFLGQKPASLGGDDEIMDAHARLLAQKLPEWDPDGHGCDMYYWYYGSYAMYQMGGARYWKPWNAAMKAAVMETQRGDGDFLGSWDPVGPWGSSGGRVYSTAMMTLCLEVYYRYAKIVGAR